MKNICLLCGTSASELFSQDKFREYFECLECALIYVPEKFHMSFENEKKRYEKHNNDHDNIGYRNFLGRIAVPIRETVLLPASGLDFGCGPSTVLADILKNYGYEMKVYDPFFASNESVLNDKYDFISATEVFEHLRKPLTVINKLISMLKFGGKLAVMTKLYDDSIDFNSWHYKNDATHISFFTIETFNWLSKNLNLKYSKIENDIYIFCLLN